VGKIPAPDNGCLIVPGLMKDRACLRIVPRVLKTIRLARDQEMGKFLKGVPECPPQVVVHWRGSMASQKSVRFSYDYPRPALTVDLAITTRGPHPQVLLIRRKKEPFAGSWALPGGFVDENEPLADAARRELEEETGVSVADLEQLYTAGDPGRDPRGWTVSVVYLTQVNPDELKPVAADDADAVSWFPLDGLPPLAFDHAMILDRVRTRLADRQA
jgi:8-oxo-dGTP diphosphatase